MAGTHVEVSTNMQNHLYKAEGRPKVYAGPKMSDYTSDKNGFGVPGDIRMMTN